MLTRLLSLPTALRSLATLVALTVLAGAVSACGSNDEAVADDAPIEEVSYVIGDPITDPAIAAIVTSDLGSDTLTTEDFRNQFEIIAMQVPQLRDDEERSRELRKNLVEDFVLTHALHGESERLGVSIESLEVLQRLDQIKSRFPSEDDYRQALDADDLTEEELIENLGDMMRQEQTLNHMAETAPEPTEAETQEFRESQAQRIRASHILFLTPEGTSEERRDATRELAQAVLDSVKAGTDFAELAERHSEDGTAPMGGDLGYFTRGQMVDAFENAAFALRDSGDVTNELVRTQYGFHIIKLTGRETGALMDTAQAREMLLQTRRRRAVEEGVMQLRQTVTVRVNPTVVDAELNDGS